jgi:hypothetical protein
MCCLFKSFSIYLSYRMNSWVYFSIKIFLVAEIYQSWSGQCKPFENIFKKLKMESGDELLILAAVIR